MPKELDGCILEVYSRQFFFNKEVQEVIAHIRASRLSGDQYSIRGSTCIGYPSKKRGNLIRAEICLIEFPQSILELESSSGYEENF